MKTKYYFNCFLIILIFVFITAGCSTHKSGEVKKETSADLNSTIQSKEKGAEKLLDLWMPKSIRDQMESQIETQITDLRMKLKQQLRIQPSEEELFNKLISDIKTSMESITTVEQMKMILSSVLSKHFSKKEINDMVDFYGSETMQSIMKELPGSALSSPAAVKEYMSKRNFTREEIELVINFSSSHTAQAMQRKMPLVTQNLMLQYQKKIKALKPIVLKLKRKFEKDRAALRKESGTADSGKQVLQRNLPVTRSNPKRTLWWVDRNGNETKINVPSGTYYFPKISPDGTKVLMTMVVGNNRNIHILDLAQGKTQQITTSFDSNIVDNQPIWSPDGKQIAYASANSRDLFRGGESKIFLKDINNTKEPTLLGSWKGGWNFPQSWKEDGSVILTGDGGAGFRNFNIGMISLEGEPRYSLLLSNYYHEVQPQLSPDGKWLAYVTTESGKMRVYVSPFPDVTKGKWQVSEGEGGSPRWSPDGKELYYLIGSNYIEAVMAVKVETEPTFSPGKAEVLFRGGMFTGPLPANGIPYDVHPDGQRFLMMKE